MTILVRGGRIIDQVGERRLDVLVEDGRVAAVGTDFDEADDWTLLDAGGCVLAPGFVDLHTHLREPGREEAETIESGSQAAALGGYTAVVAMPNTEPAQDSAASSSSCAARASAPGGARCCRRGASRWAGAARRWPRSPSSWAPACGSSPTTATACRIRC